MNHDCSKKKRDREVVIAWHQPAAVYIADFDYHRKRGLATSSPSRPLYD